jgi:hypothetical protein
VTAERGAVTRQKITSVSFRGRGHRNGHRHRFALERVDAASAAARAAVAGGAVRRLGAGSRRPDGDAAPWI